MKKRTNIRWLCLVLCFALLVESNAQDLAGRETAIEIINEYKDDAMHIFVGIWQPPVYGSNRKFGKFLVIEKLKGDNGPSKGDVVNLSYYDRPMRILVPNPIIILAKRNSESDFLYLDSKDRPFIGAVLRDLVGEMAAE